MNSFATQRAPKRMVAAQGQLDEVSPDGVVHGWCVATDPPYKPRRVSILLDGAPALVGVVCDILREDLRDAGIGDGKHSFVVTLPSAMLPAGQVSQVSLLDEETGKVVGNPLNIRWPVPDATRAVQIEAHIDAVTPEGLVSGWCWEPGDPGRQIRVNILVNGTPVGTTVAALFREDLRTAQKGSGSCGFSFFLPWASIANQSEVLVGLQDSDSGRAIGEPVILHRPQFASANERVQGLEQQVRLLRAELRAAETRQQRQEDGMAAPELFRVVAGFFQDLAEGKPRDTLVSLRARLDSIAAAYPLLALTLAPQPRVSLFVIADGSFDPLYRCLNALHRAAADRLADIVVIDPGENEDVAMLPATVRGIRLLRLRPGETLNDALRTATTPIIGLLSCRVAVAGLWLERLLDQLDRQAELALVTGAWAQEDGTAAPRLLRLNGHGELASEGSFGQGGDAIDELGFLIRREALWSAGGLDPSFSNLPAQIIDLCLRLRRAGHAVGAEAGAVATGAGVPLLDQVVPFDLQRLRGLAVDVTDATAGAGS